MSLEEIKQSELWKKLERNQAFISNFNRVTRRIFKYKDKDFSKLEIVDGKLVITTITGICQRDSKTQCRKVRIYEFSIDKNNKLLLYKKEGTIVTHRNQEYWTSESGKIENEYTCILFDCDGIVLSHQRYTDKKPLRGNILDTHRMKFLEMVDAAYDPHLQYSVGENREICLPPAFIGSSKNNYVKQYRTEDKLEIVHRITCSFKADSDTLNLSHELFVSTLASNDHFNYNPDDINIGRYAESIATVDLNGKVHISEDDEAEGITTENYVETARERFLIELREERDAISDEPDKEDIEAAYDMMIKRLEEEKDKEIGTNK